MTPPTPAADASPFRDVSKLRSRQRLVRSISMMLRDNPEAIQILAEATAELSIWRYAICDPFRAERICNATTIIKQEGSEPPKWVPDADEVESEGP